MTASQYPAVYTVFSGCSTHEERILKLRHFLELIDVLLALSVSMHSTIQRLLRFCPVAVYTAQD